MQLTSDTARPDAIRFYESLGFVGSHKGMKLHLDARKSCPGDWDPSCLFSWLQDVDGDGIFNFSTSALPPGTYEVRAAIDEAWDENYGLGGATGGANISFAVPAGNLPVHFSFVSSTNVLTVRVGQLDVPEPGTLVLVGLGLALAARSSRSHASTHGVRRTQV